MELVGLTEASNKKMKKFSGGMLQRVGIAGAMLNDPKILILDEPTAGLDPREQVRFRNLIHSVSKDRPYRLLSERQSEQGTLFRIFCEIGPSGFSPVPPNLEDVFLSVYGEKEVTGHAYSEG